MHNIIINQLSKENPPQLSFSLFLTLVDILCFDAKILCDVMIPEKYSTHHIVDYLQDL